MAINFANFAQTVAPQADAPTAGKKPTAKVWLNVGINIPVPKPDGTVETLFVNLPMGIAIDTMDAVPANKGSKDYQFLSQAKNLLMQQIQEASNQLKPGEAQLIEGLQIQLRRVAENEEPAAGENPLLAALAGKLKLVG